MGNVLFSDPAFFIGVVEDNNDPWKMGRCKVRAFGVHPEDKNAVPTGDLPWANVVLGTYNTAYKPPAVNSWVFGFFLDGRAAQQPMMLGTLLGMPGTVPATSSGPGYESMYNGQSGDYRVNPVQALYRPDLSPLARGEELETSGVYEKNVMSDVEGHQGSAYDAQYPFNWVHETLSGHVFEMDDTPGSERINIHHKTGSSVEIDSNGNVTNRSVGNSTVTIKKDGHVNVSGAYTINVKGTAHINVSNDANLTVNGDMNQTVHGDYNIGVAGNFRVNVGGVNLQRAAETNIQSTTGDTTMDAAGGMQLRSDGNMTIGTNGVATIKADEAAFVKAEGLVSVVAGSNVQVVGNDAIIQGSKISLNSSETHTPLIKSVFLGGPDPDSASEDSGNDADPNKGQTLQELPPYPRAVLNSAPLSRGGGTGPYFRDDGPVAASFAAATNNGGAPTLAQGGGNVPNNSVPNLNLTGDSAEAKKVAEEYLGRGITDAEWDRLLRATFAEASPTSEKERANVLAVILNRVKSPKFPNTIDGVLDAKSAFQAVTGTKYDPGPSFEYTKGRSEQEISSMSGAIIEYLPDIKSNHLNFTSNVTAAYTAGTNIGFRDAVSASTGSEVIGKTVFGTVGK